MEKTAYLACADYDNPKFNVVANYLKDEGFVVMYADELNCEPLEDIFKDRIDAIDICEYFFVMAFGDREDAYVNWETGYACAKGKKIGVILCGDEGTDYEVHTMLCAHGLVDLEG